MAVFAGRAGAALVAVAAACGGAGDPGGGGGPGDPDGGGAGGAIDAAGDPGADPALSHARADAATRALLLRFWRGDLGGLGYLAAQSPDPDGQLTGYWTFAQALDAVLDAAARHPEGSFAGWIETLYLAQEARGWHSNFFDDENWMALALLRAHQMTGEPRYLERAEALALEVVGAWDETCCGARPGGVWWDRAHTQKATAANAGAALTAARLAMETGDAAWLEHARRIYHYWRDEMVDPETHQVHDHIETDGRVVEWRFTYNEGLMIGAAVALHQATGEPEYLDDAHAIASFLVYQEVAPTPLGDVLADGGACSGDCRQFKGIAYRYLGELERVSGVARYRAVLDASAYSLWEIARDPASDTFAVDWASPPAPGAAVSIMQQSSAAMALSVHAALLGPASPDPAPPLVIQAEEAVLRGVGVEAQHGAFEGWGYAAGWNADRQRVDFPIEVPTAGAYRLRLRYAAGAGDAVRLVAVDGVPVREARRFEATDGWADYREATEVVELAAGRAIVSLVYRDALGSAGYLNLDRLSLEPAGRDGR